MIDNLVKMLNSDNKDDCILAASIIPNLTTRKHKKLVEKLMRRIEGKWSIWNYGLKRVLVRFNIYFEIKKNGRLRRNDYIWKKIL